MRKKANIMWSNIGWTTIQEADAATHTLGIMALVQDGKVTELKTCHNDGEEQKGRALLNGQSALPMTTEEFEKAFENGELEIR